MVSEDDSLQVVIDNFIHPSQINGIKMVNMFLKKSRQWWRTVNIISGRESKDVPLSSLFALEEINKYFQGINSDPNYKVPSYINVQKRLDSQVLTSSLSSNFSHKKKGLLMDLMACHTGSGEESQMNSPLY